MLMPHVNGGLPGILKTKPMEDKPKWPMLTLTDMVVRREVV